MATVTIQPTTQTVPYSGGSYSLSLTIEGGDWHSVPVSGDVWMAVRKKAGGVWSSWVVSGGESSGEYTAGAGIDITSNEISVKKAAATEVGGVMLWNAASDPSSSVNDFTSVSGRYYKVALDTSGKPYVNVPWTTPDLSSYAPLASPAFTGNPTAPTQTKGNNSTRIATTAFVQTALSDYATNADVQTAVGNYLPLSGGTLTGTLISRAVRPSGNSTSQSTGYGLGTSDYYWRHLYTRRVYLSSNVYLEYDSTNECVRVYGAGIATDSYISAGGVSTT